jgi:hypothetical protein
MQSQQAQGLLIEQRIEDPFKYACRISGPRFADHGCDSREFPKTPLTRLGGKLKEASKSASF